MSKFKAVIGDPPIIDNKIAERTTTALFGCSLSELIKEISLNKGGKFDFLYSEGSKINESV